MISTTSVYQTTCEFCASIRDFFVKIYDSIVEARRLQAAMELAQHLKSHNPDYKHMSLGDIMQKIAEKE